MEGSFSPILRKIAGEVVSKPKRRFSLPTEVCLEDWWLSKPSDGDGIAVSGRPLEIRKCDDPGSKFNIASPKRRFPSREFHSTKVVKRHGSTMVETSDGFLISLCGFINTYRTQQNGFPSKVCKDFIYGFPFDWDDYTARSADDELNPSEEFIESLTSGILDTFNGAQLHDLVLSLTDTERDILIERLDNNLTLNLRAELDSDFRSPEPSHTSQQVEVSSTFTHSSLVDADFSRTIITSASADKTSPASASVLAANTASKQHRPKTSADVSSVQDSTPFRRYPKRQRMMK